MMDTRSFDTARFCTVKEALAISGYGEVHLRMNLLKNGKVEHIKENIPGTSIPRILIDRKSLEQYMQRNPRGSKTQLSDEQIECLKAAGLWQK
jgi:hypothetical protein